MVSHGFRICQVVEAGWPVSPKVLPVSASPQCWAYKYMPPRLGSVCLFILTSDLVFLLADWDSGPLVEHFPNMNEEACGLRF